MSSSSSSRARQLLEELAELLGLPVDDVARAVRCRSSCEDCIRCTGDEGLPDRAPWRFGGAELDDLVRDYDPDEDPYYWDVPGL